MLSFWKALALDVQMSIHSHLYRCDDPVTSKRAAAHSDKFVATHEDKILLCLGAIIHGLTYREIAAMCSMEPVAVARRLNGMERKNMVWRKVIGIHEVKGRMFNQCDYEQRDGCAIWWAK